MADKIGIVGEKNSIGCFRLLGLDVFEEDTPRGIARTLNRMAKENYAVIFITEQAAVLAAETIDKYKSLPFPAVIPIPSGRGSLGVGLSGIRKNVEKAIGTELYLDE
jgi:V/A-type H+-transporting ATPase subunit F